MKIGFTGSRTWKDHQTIWEDLDMAYAQAQRRGEDLTVAWGVAGAGADLYVTQWVDMMQRRGEEVVDDRHPPDREKHGGRCYFIRNMEIVSSGIGRLYAYIHDDSPGATQTLGMARTLGVPRRVRWRWGDNWDVPVTIGEERPIPGLGGRDV